MASGEQAVARSVVALALEHDHRLDRGERAQRAHETARIAHRLQVDHDRLGAGIGGQEIEHLRHLDVGLGAQRHREREADHGAGGPVEDRPAQHAGLRDQRHVALAGHRPHPSGVEPQAGAHEAHRPRAQQAHPCGARRVQPAPAVLGSAAVGHDDDRAAAQLRGRSDACVDRMVADG
jgi:hypothetical protein